MPFVCAFCGSEEPPRGGEHVFPHWLSTIGLDMPRVEYFAGRLNRTPRRWTSKPFTAKVGAVCDSCNGGWMSALESRAKPVLTPLIHGETRELTQGDQRLVAAWTFKTALVAMLSSSDAERAQGHGVPREEYEALFASKEAPEPLPYSRYWCGQYVGARPAGGVRLVPVVVEIDGLPTPDWPAAYVLTLRLGRLLIQGIRFTSPSLWVDAETEPGFPTIWPSEETITWPPAGQADDETFEHMAQATSLRATDSGIRLSRFSPATDLEPSTLVGSMLRQPVPCGQHHIYFPAVLAFEAAHEDVRYVFISECECNVAYLMIAERDGVHFRHSGTLSDMTEAFDLIEGDVYQLEDNNGIFIYKVLS